MNMSFIQEKARSAMSKNNKLINSMKALAKQNQARNVAKASNEMVPMIYASIALALHSTCGFGYKRINDVFVESQRIWEGFSGNPEDMIKLCEEQTGVSVAFGRTEKDNEI